ncbi:hypothetical protein BC939DRAFT_511440 [Gamsiella multidivaricata]|uniref:uncharacterized protein n=1 Tax=Gamsiella multidivaricata TaxID=101098 RepID=UPI00221E5874|nr:uncharacterized protein BC939DRAFT_511440 [Gamsiella multidivaricata]KAG0365077.1 hypothetical protein BGZ54_006882 [Gamsiella multidivaricata]KAI7816301.1 hypothetical protein BC939DRAFT_511440 [Gamsiella multidivaricata]
MTIALPTTSFHDLDESTDATLITGLKDTDNNPPIVNNALQLVPLSLEENTTLASGKEAIAPSSDEEGVVPSNDEEGAVPSNDEERVIPTLRLCPARETVHTAPSSGTEVSANNDSTGVSQKQDLSMGSNQASTTHTSKTNSDVNTEIKPEVKADTNIVSITRGTNEIVTKAHAEANTDADDKIANKIGVSSADDEEPQQEQVVPDAASTATLADDGEAAEHGTDTIPREDPSDTNKLSISKSDSRTDFTFVDKNPSAKGKDKITTALATPDAGPSDKDRAAPVLIAANPPPATSVKQHKKSRRKVKLPIPEPVPELSYKKAVTSSSKKSATIPSDDEDPLSSPDVSCAEQESSVSTAATRREPVRKMGHRVRHLKNPEDLVPYIIRINEHGPQGYVDSSDTGSSSSRSTRSRAIKFKLQGKDITLLKEDEFDELTDGVSQPIRQEIRKTIMDFCRDLSAGKFESCLKDGFIYLMPYEYEDRPKDIEKIMKIDVSRCQDQDVISAIKVGSSGNPAKRTVNYRSAHCRVDTEWMRAFPSSDCKRDVGTKPIVFLNLLERILHRWLIGHQYDVICSELKKSQQRQGQRHIEIFWFHLGPHRMTHREAFDETYNALKPFILSCLKVFRKLEPVHKRLRRHAKKESAKK